MITLKEVRIRIRAIRSASGDAEVQHSIMGTLYVDTLKAIADGHKNPKRLASEALEAQKIPFPRWCA
jgi:hypothetical protein